MSSPREQELGPRQRHAPTCEQGLLLSLTLLFPPPWRTLIVSIVVGLEEKKKLKGSSYRLHS